LGGKRPSPRKGGADGRQFFGKTEEKKVVEEVLCPERPKEKRKPPKRKNSWERVASGKKPENPKKEERRPKNCPEET